MASEPQCQRDIREQRKHRADGGEPINSETRTIQQNGQSLYANLTEFGAITHNLSCGDEIVVETHASGIWITTKND